MRKITFILCLSTVLFGFKSKKHTAYFHSNNDVKISEINQSESKLRRTNKTSFSKNEKLIEQNGASNQTYIKPHHNEEVYASIGESISIETNPNEKRIEAASEKPIAAMAKPRRTSRAFHGLSLLGFLLWIIGALISYPLGLIGLLLCFISLLSLRNRKKRFSGKGFSVVPATISTVASFIAMLIIPIGILGIGSVIVQCAILAYYATG